MARNITVTFEDGSTHVYQNAPDNITPDMVTMRAQKDFGKSVTALDGGRGIPVSEIPGPRATGSAVDQIPGYGKPVPAAIVQPELTTGQKLYQQVRPLVAPTVEALGAAGGAALGVPAGPAGVVGGAGLGYGAAKEALELADVYMGGKQPRQGSAQITEPLRNVLEGATMEAGGQAVAPYLAKGVGKVADFVTTPSQRAARIARDALGKDVPAVVNLLRNAPPDATVAQITAKIENPTWQALIKEALEKDPQFTRKLNLLSEEQSLNALAKLAGGTTAAETRTTTELAKTNLNKVTTPMREAALGRANLGKYVADEAIVREANDLAAMIGSGGKIDPARFATQATGAEQSLRSVGVKPLQGAPLADKIQSISHNPAFAENDLIEGATLKVAEGIRNWTNSKGVLDASALEAIRKNAVDAAIAKLRPGADATTQRNAAASVMSKIKPLIDDAIEQAGGAGWRNYLAAHSQGMRKIAEKQLTGEALRLWKTDKNAFVRLVQNESPEAVEKILGPGNYNIAKELSDDVMNVLRTQADKHLTNLSIKQQIGEGGVALTQLLKQNSFRFRVPGFLSFLATASNKAISELEQAIGSNSMKILTQAMKSPEGAKNLLETLPAVERNRVLSLLADPSKWIPGVSSTGLIASGKVKNALSSEQGNQNALNND